MSSNSPPRTSALLDEPVGRTLYRSTVPTTIGAVAMILYYLADTWFIGLLGTSELAALGFTFPVTIFVTYFGVGLGIGTSALVARAMGSHDTGEASRITVAALLFGFLVGVVFLYPALHSINWLFPRLGAAPQRLVLIEQFMRIWFLGMPLLLMQFAGTAVIRATGNARLHGTLMVVGALVNALLDPLLIFGLGPVPAMGIGGAALATVLAWACTVAIICWHLASREKLLVLRPPPLRELLATWQRLLRISLPASLANMITPVSTGVITATLATYGPTAVAAYGVISRLESFILIVVLGMSMSLPPFLSQNYGARRFERVCEGLRLTLRFVLYWQLALYLVVAVAAPWIATLFTRDVDVQQIIVVALRILPASYAFQGMVVLSASSFNALHAPRNGLLTSVLRFAVFYVPLALMGNKLGGITGLFAGAALGNLLAGLVVSRWATRYAARLLAEGGA